jgi:hypothetical protein
MTSLNTVVFYNVTPYSVAALSLLALESCCSCGQCRMVGCPKDGVSCVFGTARGKTPERTPWHVEGRLSSERISSRFEVLYILTL